MGRELLEQARAWIAAHGADVMMPRGDEITQAQGDRRFYQVRPVFTILPSINEGDGAINAPARLIPFLAGLEHDLSEKALADILKHHGVELSDIRFMRFGGTLTTFLKNQLTGLTINATEIHVRFFKAMQTFTPISDLLHEARNGNPLVHLAMLHLNSPSVWADTIIKERQAGVYQNTAYAQPLNPINFGLVIERVMGLEDLPKRSFSEFIDRLGMLNESMISKRLDLSSPWEILMARLERGSDFASDMFEHVCSVIDPKIQALMLKAILSLDSSTTRLYPAKVMKQLSLLPGACYLRGALSSTVLKINLLDANFWEVEEHQLKNTSYSELLSRPELILSKVAKEVLAIKPGHMGLSHFTAFARLSFMNLPPQVIDFRPESLLNHLFDAYDIFKKPEKCTGLEIEEIDSLAMLGIKEAVNQIVRNHTLDVDAFNHRSSEDKLMMIKTGVNPKGFTGLNTKQKGEFLESVLGL